MSDNSFANIVDVICQNDPRYCDEAYYFIRDALDFATKTLKKPRSGPQKHISGTELLGCIRQFALREYGPMAYTVLKSWEVLSTEDFGELVFNLVEAGALGKTEDDQRQDFANGYDFEAAFVHPFIPDSESGRAGKEAERTKPEVSG